MSIKVDPKELVYYFGANSVNVIVCASSVTVTLHLCASNVNVTALQTWMQHLQLLSNLTFLCNVIRCWTSVLP